MSGSKSMTIEFLMMKREVALRNVAQMKRTFPDNLAIQNETDEYIRSLLDTAQEALKELEAARALVVDNITVFK